MLIRFNIELVTNNYHSDYIILGKDRSDIACISVFRYGNQLEMVSAQSRARGRHVTSRESPTSHHLQHRTRRARTNSKTHLSELKQSGHFSISRARNGREQRAGTRHAKICIVCIWLMIGRLRSSFLCKRQQRTMLNWFQYPLHNYCVFRAATYRAERVAVWCLVPVRALFSLFSETLSLSLLSACYCCVRQQLSSVRRARNTVSFGRIVRLFIVEPVFYDRFYSGSFRGHCWRDRFRQSGRTDDDAVYFVTADVRYFFDYFREDNAVTIK